MKKILEKLEKHLLYVIWFIVCLILLGIYFYKFADGNLSASKADFGTFGDYVGGILNPLISLAALIYAKRAFEVQRKQIAEQEEQIKDQKADRDLDNFRENFFFLLQKYDDKKSNIKFEDFNQKIKNIIKNPNLDYSNISYMLFLFQFISNNQNLQNKDKKEFYSILIQIADDNEKIHFFYYGLNNAEIKQQIEKYGLFENIDISHTYRGSTSKATFNPPINVELTEELKSFYNPKAYKYEH